MKKKTPKYWKKKAIELAKEIKRKQQPYCDKCPKTLAQGWQVHAHHIVPVGYDKTAADLDNLLVLCASCHSLGRQSAHDNPIQFGRWFDEKYPGKYDRLMAIANEYVKTKFPKIDWELEFQKLSEMSKLNLK